MCWRWHVKRDWSIRSVRFNEVAERVPHLAKVSPAWDGQRQWHIQDVHAAGGVSAILMELAEKPGALDLDAMTVTGKTMRENLEGVRNRKPGVYPANHATAQPARWFMRPLRQSCPRGRGH